LTYPPIPLRPVAPGMCPTSALEALQAPSTSSILGAKNHLRFSAIAFIRTGGCFSVKGRRMYDGMLEMHGNAHSVHPSTRFASRPSASSSCHNAEQLLHLSRIECSTFDGVSQSHEPIGPRNGRICVGCAPILPHTSNCLWSALIRARYEDVLWSYVIGRGPYLESAILLSTAPP
jgi:hypothetical protein